MKVLFITHKWQARTGESCAKALQQLGHEVELSWGKIGSTSTVTKYYNWIKRTRNIGSNTAKLERYILNQIIVNKANSMQPDLIIVNAGGEVFPETLVALRKNTDARIICWAGDDPNTYSLAPHYLGGAKYYDHYFVGDPSWYTNNLKDAGVKRCTLLSYGADPDIYNPTELSNIDRLKYFTEVTHLGVLHNVRKELLVQLLDYDIGLWGATTSKFFSGSSNIPKRLIPKVRSGIVQAEVSNKIYNASKICLNILHPQLNSCYNNKTFEISASGAFQLINFKDQKKEYYADDEMVTFSSVNELKSLLTYYLLNDRERDEIAFRAFQRTLSCHLFKHRMEQLLAECF